MRWASLALVAVFLVAPLAAGQTLYMSGTQRVGNADTQPMPFKTTLGTEPRIYVFPAGAPTVGAPASWSTGATTHTFADGSVSVVFFPGSTGGSTSATKEWTVTLTVGTQAPRVQTRVDSNPTDTNPLAVVFGGITGTGAVRVSIAPTATASADAFLSYDGPDVGAHVFIDPGNPAPTASLSGPTDVVLPEDYTFTIQGADTLGGKIVAWTLDADGDGVIDRQQQGIATAILLRDETWTFGQPGTYTATVTVMDDGGKEATATKQVLVYPPLVADAGGPYGAQPGQLVSISPSIAGGRPSDAVTCQWQGQGIQSTDTCQTSVRRNTVGTSALTLTVSKGGRTVVDTTDFVVQQVEQDADGDGIKDDEDNCPNVPNPTQANLDGDSQGDACDPDDDGDGVADIIDNCPIVANTDQRDTDRDGVGDACDDDDDGDGVADGVDNCPLMRNPDQLDRDNDGKGDVCDDDRDGDGVPNDLDAFPDDKNEWEDTDFDGIGDNEDTDDDNDGFSDEEELAAGSDPKDYNSRPVPPPAGGTDETDQDTPGFSLLLVLVALGVALRRRR